MARSLRALTLRSTAVRRHRGGEQGAVNEFVPSEQAGRSSTAWWAIDKLCRYIIPLRMHLYVDYNTLILAPSGSSTGTTAKVSSRCQ